MAAGDDDKRMNDSDIRPGNSAFTPALFGIFNVGKD
jgi:hypothetical protein